MAIPRSIRTRAVEAVAAFLEADAELAPLFGDRIYLQQYDSMGPLVTLKPSPRQVHVYAGRADKAPGTTGLSTRDFEIIIEWFSPRNELEHTRGENSILDEVEYMMNRLFAGEAASPGRLYDPDNAGKMITQRISAVTLSEPLIADGEAAVLRRITVTFAADETTEGLRPYEVA